MISNKIARFLSKDKDIKTTRHKIHYSDYSVYEKELLDFFTWVNNFQDMEQLKLLLTDLPISTFCNYKEIILDYIHSKVVTEKTEVVCYLELEAIISALNIYQAILNENKLLSKVTASTVYRYAEKDLDYLFQLYSYYLYEQNSQLVENATIEYYKRIDTLPKNKTLLEIYTRIGNNYESDLKKDYCRLVNSYECEKKKMGDIGIRERHAEMKTLVIRHQQRTRNFRRKT